MDFNEELKNLISNFNGELKPLQNELQNLKKTSDAIKVSMLSRFDKVRSKIKEDAELALNLLNNININSSVSSPYWYYEYSNSFEYFSILTSCNQRIVIQYYFKHTGNKLSSVEIKFKTTSHLDEVSAVDCVQCSSDYDDINKEMIISMYDSGEYHTGLLKTVQNYLSRIKENYNKIISFNKNIIQKSSYQSECNTNWNEYIMYILKWASEHTDESNFGDSPKSYIEWKSEVEE